jgi:hypothetical protein
MGGLVKHRAHALVSALGDPHEQNCDLGFEQDRYPDFRNLAAVFCNFEQFWRRK